MNQRDNLDSVKTRALTDIPGLRKTTIILFVLSVAISLNATGNHLEKQLYWRIYLNTVIQLLMLGLLIFYFKIPVKWRVIFLSLIIGLGSAVAFYQNGLIAILKTGIFIAPVVLSMAVNSRFSFLVLIINTIYYLLISAAFINGLIPLPDLDSLTKRPAIPLDAITLFVFSVSLLTLISGMKEQLLENFQKFQTQNDQLKEEEKKLEYLRSDLQRNVQNRTEELKNSETSLVNTRNKLLEQIETIQQQNSVLESTVLEIKSTQANLIQSRKLTSLGSLTTGISHELNNPLNFIHGALAILEQKPEIHEDEETKKIIEILKTGNVRIKNIVKSLNQFSPKSDDSTSICNLPEIVSDAHLMVKHLFDVNKVFTIKNPDFECLVRAHSDKIHQLFLNLIHNAAQALGEQGKVEVSFSTDSERQSITVHIQDNGSGINPDILNKITEPFFTTKPAGSGTGLGLYISRQIVESHQGTLRFLSTPGKGTEVRVTLPVSTGLQQH